MVATRLYWLDWLKLFAIFLVVWGHALFHFGDIPMEEKYNGVSGFIYSFHMPLFMTISGFFSYKLVSGLGMEVLWKKFIQLIIPTISLISLCLYFGIKDQNFWYLGSLFLCYFFFWMFFKLNIPQWLRVVFCLLFFFFVFPLFPRIPIIRFYKLDYMLPFFGLGLIIKHFSTVLEKRSSLLCLCSGILFVLMEVFWDSSFIWYNSFSNWIDYKKIVVEGLFCFDGKNLLQSLFRYSVGAIGTLFFVSFFLYLSQKIKFQSHIVDFFNRKILGYTMQIYVLQTFIVQINIFQIRMSTENMFLFQYVETGLLSIAITFTCIFIAKILEKSKIISLLFFGQNKFK